MSRVAVVTGAAGGMGRSICRDLAQRGDRVAVLDADAGAAREVAADLMSEGGSAAACGVDVSDPAAVDAAFAQVRSDLGAVEILVTCAAISRWEALTDMELTSWDQVIAVNLTGTFLCLRAAIPDMVAAGWGRVVTISSTAALTGHPLHAHYSASKGGVVALTRAVAREYAAQGITVNTIAPGAVDTPMFRRSRAGSDANYASRIPVGRIGTGDDIAAACLYLCSDAAGYVTGQVIGVNGGVLP